MKIYIRNDFASHLRLLNISSLPLITIATTIGLPTDGMDGISDTILHRDPARHCALAGSRVQRSFGQKMEDKTYNMMNNAFLISHICIIFGALES